MGQIEAYEVDIGKGHTSAGIRNLDNDEEDHSDKEAEGAEDVE